MNVIPVRVGECDCNRSVYVGICISLSVLLLLSFFGMIYYCYRSHDPMVKHLLHHCPLRMHNLCCSKPSPSQTHLPSAVELANIQVTDTSFNNISSASGYLSPIAVRKFLDEGNEDDDILYESIVSLAGSHNQDTV